MIQGIPLWLPFLITLISLILAVAYFFIPLLGQVSGLAFFGILGAFNLGMWIIVLGVNAIASALNTITNDPITIFIFIAFGLIVIYGYYYFSKKKKRRK